MKNNIKQIPYGVTNYGLTVQHNKIIFISPVHFLHINLEKKDAPRNVHKKEIKK